MDLQKNRSNNIQVLLTVFLTLIIPCPVFYNLGLRGMLWAIIMVFIFFCSTFILSKKIEHYRLIFFCFISSILIGSITAFHYVDIKYFFILMLYIGYSLLFCLLEEKQLRQFTDFASIFILILEIGAIIGFVYSHCGGNPIAQFPNIDERINYVYITTCTNNIFGNFIRPSGIYDEPGAFSFYIIAIVIMRIHFEKDSTFSFILLLLGLITTSLTHFLCMIILIFPLSKNIEKKKKMLIVLLSSLFVIMLVVFFYDVIDVFVLRRLQFDSTKGFTGNTRAGQIEGCLKSIKENGLLYGNYSLSPDLKKYKYGVIGENPLSPITNNGLFNSVPYYTFLISAFWAFILSFKFKHLASIVLFVQRPYQSNLGYSFFLVFFLYMALSDIKLFFPKNKIVKIIINQKTTD